MTLTDYMCLEKKEVDLPALKTALTHQYNDSKIPQKCAEEDQSQSLETIVTTLGSTEGK